MSCALQASASERCCRSPSSRWHVRGHAAHEAPAFDPFQGGDLFGSFYGRPDPYADFPEPYTANLDAASAIALKLEPLEPRAAEQQRGRVEYGWVESAICDYYAPLPPPCHPFNVDVAAAPNSPLNHAAMFADDAMMLSMSDLLPPTESYR